MAFMQNKNDEISNKKRSFMTTFEHCQNNFGLKN